METNSIVNIEQLFLLYILRKDKFIRAKNIDEYAWTIKHHEYVQDKLLTLHDLKDTERKSTKSVIIEEAIKKIPVPGSKLREFMLKETNLGFGLYDLESDFIWYYPRFSSLQEGFYKGSFLLEQPLSLEEEAMVKYFV